MSTEMPFLQHLMELRRALIRSLWGVAFGFLIVYHFSEQIFGFLLKPLCRTLSSSETATCPIVYTGVAEPFMVYLKVGLVGGIFVSVPWIFLQIWGFIRPGLKDTEQKFVFPFVALGSLMFLGGALLGYFYIFPLAFEFFTQQALAPIQPMLSMENYFSFASGLLFAFGFLFEIPVFVVLLNWIGVIPSASLWKTWRIATAGIFVLAAILTPADPYTMLLLGVPLATFYILALGFCSIQERVRGRTAQGI